MTRVRLKSNPDITGVLVGKNPHNPAEVEWKDEHDRVWITGRDRLEIIEDEPEQPGDHKIELQLLDMLDRLRDEFNLQIECAMRDIRRTMGETR